MKQIFLDIDKCNGCMSCVQACAAEHSPSKSIVGALLDGTISRIFVQSVGGKPYPITCMHCEEPACVDVCMSGAMQKDPETGIVTNEGHEQSCAGCWMCIMACPYGVIAQDHERRKAVKCDRCSGKEIPACVASCPNNALVFADPGVYSDGVRVEAIKKALRAG